jgi:hypothetical protein
LRHLQSGRVNARADRLDVRAGRLDVRAEITARAGRFTA